MRTDRQTDVICTILFSFAQFRQMTRNNEMKYIPTQCVVRPVEIQALF
jgi:hypothetical protein